MRSVILPLVVVNAVVFVLQFLFEPVTGLIVLDQSRVLFEPWRLVTAMFAHGSFTHIFFNMFALLMFGPLLEQRIGSKNFLLVYFVSGIVASIAAAFLYPFSLGASGAIFGMLGALVVLMPDLRILLFFAIPMPLWVASIGWVLIDTFGLVSSSTGVANAAHLAGIAVGFAIGYYLKRTLAEPEVVFINR